MKVRFCRATQNKRYFSSSSLLKLCLFTYLLKLSPKSYQVFKSLNPCSVAVFPLIGYKIDNAFQSFLSFPCHREYFQLHSVVFFLNLVRSLHFPLLILCAAVHTYLNIWFLLEIHETCNVLHSKFVT